MNSTGLFQINFVRWGFILGGVSIFFLVIFNSLLGVDWLIFNYFTGRLLMYIITFFILTKAILERKKLNHGFISFSSSFLEGLFVFMIASILKIAFEFTYLYAIYPESLIIIRNATIETTKELYRSMNITEKDISIFVKKVEAQDLSFGFIKVLFQLIFSFIVGVVISSIISLFTKKSRPMFDA